jgi:hypothetical protein
MIKVKLHTNWCDDKEIREEFNKSTKNQDYKWEDIELTLNDDYDYFVILNHPRHNQFNPKKTILFQCETKPTRDRWGYWANPRKEDFFFVYSTEEFHNFDKWYLNKTYNQLQESPIKDKILSGIVSTNYTLPGHKQRLDFVLNHLSKVDGYDHYGRGHLPFPWYKGELKNKEDGLLSYKYTFNAENNKEDNYFTEKFIDAILCETLVFYDGCPNIDKFFNPECYVKINLDNPQEAVQIIQDGIKNNLWEEKIDIIREEKRKLLEERNPMNVIQQIIKGEIKY